jgi:hypothetical protein
MMMMTMTMMTSQVNYVLGNNLLCFCHMKPIKMFPLGEMQMFLNITTGGSCSTHFTLQQCFLGPLLPQTPSHKLS